MISQFLKLKVMFHFVEVDNKGGATISWNSYPSIGDAHGTQSSIAERTIILGRTRG